MVRIILCGINLENEKYDSDDSDFIRMVCNSFFNHFRSSFHSTSSQYHYLNFVFNVKYHFPSFHNTQEEFLKGRKRYTCHSDDSDEDSDEDSDQEESDDGDGKKERSSILYLILFLTLFNIFHNTSIFNSIHLL